MKFYINICFRSETELSEVRINKDFRAYAAMADIAMKPLPWSLMVNLNHFVIHINYWLCTVPVAAKPPEDRQIASAAQRRWQPGGRYSDFGSSLLLALP